MVLPNLRKRIPYPLPCLNLITLITYLFFLSLFACLACLRANLCLHTLAPPLIVHVVLAYQHTYVIKSFSSFVFSFHQSFLLFSFQSFFYSPPGLASHFSLFSTVFTFLTSFSQLASLPACCCFCVASGLFRNFNCLGLGQLRLKLV